MRKDSGCSLALPFHCPREVVNPAPWFTQPLVAVTTKALEVSLGRASQGLACGC